MAQYWALSSGYWSNLNNWLTAISPGNEQAGELPGPADDVFTRNNYVVIDISTRVNSIQNVLNTSFFQNNTNSRVGNFILTPGVSLTAQNIVGTYPNCIIFPVAGTATIVGNLCASQNFPISNSYRAVPHVAANLGPGTLNIYGNVTAFSNTDSNGAATDVGFGLRQEFASVTNTADGTLNIYGDVINRDVLAANTLANLGPGTVNIVGNLSGMEWIQTTQIWTGTQFIPRPLQNGTTNNSGYAVSNYSSGTINITGDLHNRMVGALLHSGDGTTNIYGNVFKNPLSTQNMTVHCNGPGNVNIYGSVYLLGRAITTNTALPNVNTPIANTGVGTINVYGNIINNGEPGAGTNFQAVGALCTGPGRINIYGDLSASANGAASNWGVWNVGPGTIVVYGNVYGGAGVDSRGINHNNGVVQITGSVVSGNGARSYGIIQSASGSVTVKTVVGGVSAGFGRTPSLWNNTTFGTCYIEEIKLGEDGGYPIDGTRVIFLRKPNNQVNFIASTSASLFQISSIGGQWFTSILSPSSLTLFTSLSGFGTIAPLLSNVRSGTTFDFNQLTGTLVIPPFQTVTSGTPVDTLTSFGTFFTDLPRAWQTQTSAITAANSLGTRFKNIITLPETTNLWLLDT